MPFNPSPGKRRWLLASAFAAALIFLILSSLPLFVERIFLAPLLDRAGLSDYRVVVSRFGPGGAAFHVSGRSAGSIITGGNIRAKWTLPGLFQRRLDRLSLDGLMVHLPVRNGSGSMPTGSSGSSPLPFLVNDVQIVNSVVFVRHGGRVFFLPISLIAKLQEPGEGPGKDNVHYSATFNVAEQEFEAELIYDTGLGRLSGQVQGKMRLAPVAQIFPLSFELHPELKGTAEVVARYTLHRAPFRVEEVEAEMLFQDLDIGAGDLHIRSVDGKTTKIMLTGEGGSYTVKAGGFKLDGPFAATLDTDMTVAMTEKFIGWQGNIFVQPEAGQKGVGLITLDEIPLFHLRHEGEAADDAAEVRFRGETSSQSDAGRVLLHYAGRKVQMDSLSMEGKVAYTSQNGPNDVTAEFSLNGKGLLADSRDAGLSIPQFGIKGHIRIPSLSENVGAMINGSVSLVDGVLQLPQQEITLQKIQLVLPYTWPGHETSGQGDIRIENIYFRQTELGSFLGLIDQTGYDISLQGGLKTILAPETGINLGGTLQLGPEKGPVVEVNYDTENSWLDVQSIASFYPQLTSVTGSAKLDMHGSMRFDTCGMEGTLSAQLHDGNFEIPEAKLALEDVQLDINVPNLPNIETEPAQIFSIGTARSNQIVVHDLQTQFRVESPESLFVEKISGKWSGGRIFTSSFRLHRAKQELELALFCDRLKLAGILTQFSLAEAEGEGRLSGRIPLIYKDRNIFVDDGFLFTSPGEKGNLKIKQSKHLTVGIPADVPQFSPLHFAGAALSDFEYNWAKLNIVSEEENLLLKLQIDGKPREKLPYRFDATNNVFVRLEEGAAGGLDQPVKLDVNFKVPVNELFRYQTKIMPLLRNLK